MIRAELQKERARHGHPCRRLGEGWMCWRNRGDDWKWRSLYGRWQDCVATVESSTLRASYCQDLARTPERLLLLRRAGTGGGGRAKPRQALRLSPPHLKPSQPPQPPTRPAYPQGIWGLETSVKEWDFFLTHIFLFLHN